MNSNLTVHNRTRAQAKILKLNEIEPTKLNKLNPTLAHLHHSIVYIGRTKSNSKDH